MKRSKFWRLVFFILLYAGLAACRASSPQATRSGAEIGVTPSAQAEQAAQTASITPTAPVQSTPTLTPLPPLAVLLAPQGSDATLADRISSQLKPAVEKAGLRWETRQSLSPGSLEPELRLVVVLPPDPGVAELVTAAPQVLFLAVGIPGLQPASNLSLVGAQGQRPDQQGFIAGVIAAIITPDWRVGVLGPGDTPSARAARQGFINGAVYFCGLCLPYHGPSVDYPVYLDLSSGASEQEIQAALQGLKDMAVKTVYVTPGSLSSPLTSALAQAGLNVLGNGTPAPDLVQSWVASVDADPVPAVLDLLPSLLAGQGGQSVEISLSLSNINSALFSAGRQERVQEILADLLAGYIDTGIDPLSGENR